MTHANHYSGDVDLTHRSNGDLILRSVAVWRENFDDANSRTMTAQPGFKHDGPSIPFLFRFMLSFTLTIPAALHDWAYARHLWDDGSDMTRMEADRIIREAARISQRRARVTKSSWAGPMLQAVHFAQRWTVWAGLMVGGWVAWRKSHGRELYDQVVRSEILGRVPGEEE